MNRTSIEWCRTYAADGSFTEGYSVNPVRFRPHGSDRLTTMCQKVSPGCKNCYAEGITRRWWPKQDLVRIDALGYNWPNPEFPGYTALGVSDKFGEFVLDESMLLAVLKHKKPGKVFWGDMTDLFGDWVKDEWLDKMFAVMALTPHLTHLVLTKRAERMRTYWTAVGRKDALQNWITEFCLNLSERESKRIVGAMPNGWGGVPLRNVWLGVSAENQEYAEKRIPLLIQTPAACRFVSYEPALEAVDFDRFFIEPDLRCRTGFQQGFGMEAGYCGTCAGHISDPVHHSPAGAIDWIIVGGESGPSARPFNVEWARQTVKQCRDAGTAVFVKQMGAKPHDGNTCKYDPTPDHHGLPHGHTFPYLNLNDAKGGDINEWPEELRVRQFPEVHS